MSILDPRNYQKLFLASASREHFSAERLARQCRSFCMRQFARDERGVVAILFGLTVTILVAIVGGAVDYARWHAANEKTVQAMDAAVLAAGRALQLGKTDAEAIQIALNYYNQTKSDNLSVDAVTFNVENNSTEVVAVSNSKVKMTFLNVAGVSELPVNGTSRAVIAAGANSGSHVEISLMLDTTGSMGWASSSGGTKMSHLKAAAKDLIDIVVWTDQSEFTSRVALAPFAPYVNVSTTYAADVTNNSSTKCVKERSNSNRYTDEAPSGSNGYFDKKNSGGCGKPIVPLSSDTYSLKAAIDQLPTSGSTAGHLGTAWSWYLLSPKWNSIWPTASEPMSYNMLTQLNPDGQPLLRKIAVLMTDGEYNKQYSGGSSTTQARAICANMKAAGIEVYTIGFEIAVGGEADTTMSQCATSADHYYNAEDGNALRSAFRDIALKISTLRIAE